MTQQRSDRIVGYVILSILALFVVASCLLPAPGGKRGSPEVAFRAKGKQMLIGISRHQETTPGDDFHVPVTWNLLFQYMVELKPGSESFAGRHVDEYAMGPIPTADMMTGRVSRERIIEVAKDIGIPEQTWERVMGFWFSRIPEEFESNSKDVIIGFSRQKLENGRMYAVLLTADGVPRGGLPRTKQVRDLLEADRRARERLNLAPLPPEFRSWLLTGEPASVGDGSFIPPPIQ